MNSWRSTKTLENPCKCTANLLLGGKKKVSSGAFLVNTQETGSTDG